MTLGERQEIVRLRQTLPDFERESASRIPIIRDDSGNVPVYLEGGGLSFSALGEGGRKAVADYLDPLGVIPYQLDGDDDVIPIIRDDDGNVVLWLENGGLACSFLSKSLIAQIIAQVQGRQYGFGRKAPVATDGRSLYRYRAKLARMKGGEVIRPTVMLVGDSYLELPALPQAIATGLYTAHGKASDGWLSAHNPNSINGITRTTVGAWMNYDASDGVAPANGCGIDGKSTSTTGTDKREIFYNIKCTEFTVYYYDGAGAINFIRYAADGTTVEATTPLVFGGTNTFKSYTFTGQPDQLRNYEVNTANNAGTVVIHGYRATRNSAAGIIVDKCGNAGATSDNLTLFSGQIANYQAMQPDLIVVALGTNNASVKSTTLQFESDIPALIDAYRALWPTVGIVLIAEPLCTGAKQSPLIDYRDAAYEIALAKNCEFYSMFDDWADFSTMDALGMFLGDGIHPSDAGSAFTSRRLTQLLGL